MATFASAMTDDFGDRFAGDSRAWISCASVALRHQGTAVRTGHMRKRRLGKRECCKVKVGFRVAIKICINQHTVDFQINSDEV